MKLISLITGGLFLAACSAYGAGQPNSTPGTTTKATPLVEAPIPESVFNIPASPRQGRNPFFPASQAVLPRVKTNATGDVETTALVLNGITSPPKRMAMINGRSFEAGETGDVKLPNGQRITIRCVEIHDDRVVIMVAGQKRELQLRSKWA